MDESRNRIVDVVEQAADIARGAWRRLWAIQLLAMLGPALIFVSVRAPLPPAAAAELWTAGWVLSLVVWAPLWTGLHRYAVGGAAAERIRLAGLQFGKAELHFLALGVLAMTALVMALLPLVAVSAGVFILFRPLGLVALGPLGAFQISFLIAAGVWLAGLAGLGWAAARLALAPAATVGRRRLVVAESWSMSQGRAIAVAGAWCLAQAPLLLALALLALVDSAELQDGIGSRSRWPMIDAVLAGGAVGLVSAFIHIPLTAGVLGVVYRDYRAARARNAPPLHRRLRVVAAEISPFAAGAFAGGKR